MTGGGIRKNEPAVLDAAEAAELLALAERVRGAFIAAGPTYWRSVPT